MKVRVGYLDVLAIIGLVALIAGLVMGQSALSLAGAGVFVVIFVLTMFKVLRSGKATRNPTQKP